MKAIQYSAYGDSSVIESSEVDKPVPKEGEILIKVNAVSVNPMDIKVRSGALKEHMPVKLPFIPGLDLAGTVEAIGNNVSRLKVGDQVFATGFGGTYAEYATIKAEQAALVPSNITLPKAAALAVSLVTGYTFLVENGELKAGQKVLIQGASGGVGGIMVQMAKALGAHVIGTASTAGVETVRSFGADEVIDYKTQDFTQLVKEVDLVIDLVGGETQKRSFEVVKKGGKLLSAVAPPAQDLAEKHGVSAAFYSSNPSHKKLEFGAKMVEEGKIKPNVSETMKLDDAAQAQDKVTAGGVEGKIVLEVA